MFGRKGGFAPPAVGDPAPEFTLEGTRGGPHLLADLRRHGPVALREVSTAYRALRPGSRWPLRTVYFIGTDGRVRFA